MQKKDCNNRASQQTFGPSYFVMALENCVIRYSFSVSEGLKGISFLFLKKYNCERNLWKGLSMLGVVKKEEAAHNQSIRTKDKLNVVCTPFLLVEMVHLIYNGFMFKG